MFSPTRQRALSLATFVALPLFAACTTDGPADPPTAATLNRAGYQQPGAHRQYGTPSKLGNGMARTYVVVDAKDGQRPLELGVAIDQDGLQGLPADMRMLHMPFPNHAPEPYTFMMLDWNPQGHEPPGAYDVPHFDFHFYWQAESEVMAIDPSDPDFASKANALPSGDFLPPFYILPIPPFLPPSAIAVPGMGVHWSDVRSPEIQHLLGNAEGWAEFTKTLIYGSWDGELTFVEPMITRAYLLSHPDELIPIPQPVRYPKPGWYPSAYRITFDAQAKEYRVGMTGFGWHD